MHIDAIEAVFPTRELNNDQILDLVREHSAATFDGDLELALKLIAKFLRLSGAKNRRWLAEGEKPLTLIETAVQGALRKADLDKRDIDLLIYVGVGKGFIEPGQSYMVAHSLGMEGVECFDILDACMSWSRAMHIADGFLQMKRYRRIMIINGEFSLFPGGPIFPHNYCLRNAEQITYTFASYTIGNAATATIVSADDGNRWSWRFASRPDLADLCTVPGFGLGLFSNGAEKIGKNGAFQFTSYGKDLHAYARPHLLQLMKEIIAERGEAKLIFPHASSFREWELFATELNLASRVYHVYPEYGNLVSASVPAGMALAIAEGRVQRGDQLACWVGSAGMSYSAYTFQY